MKVGAVGVVARADSSRLTRVIEADGCAVMPGLVQAHIHLVHSLFRGLADDVSAPRVAPALHPAARGRSRRGEPNSERRARGGGVLAGRHDELLDMGTVHGHEVVFDALARSGLRAVSGKA